MPSRRSYDQYCAVARAMDVIGERWTVLLVRDLLLGPKRYKDLLAGLPGIGTNLLADRLRELEGAGLIERTVLPPPAGSAVYQLTEAGRALEPAMVALGRWGARFLGAPRKTDVMVPRAYFVAMRGTFQPEAAAGINQTYEVRIGDLVFEVRVEHGRLTTSEGRAANPDAVLTMDVETLNALLFRLLTPAAALASGRVHLSGDAHSLERFVGLFGFHGRPGMMDRPSALAARKAAVGTRRATRSAR
jgi:DNA-binding HxlR family transcriptional regulator/putative sterol carrier protein